MSNGLTTDDIRHFIMDRSVEDNRLDMDLQFSDDEVLKAMDRCRTHYASLPPVSLGVSEGHPLPADNFCFYHGVVYQLFLALYSKLTRNDVNYAAGGVEVSLERTKIGYLKEQLPMHREEFLSMAIERKKRINMIQGMGPVG